MVREHDKLTLTIRPENGLPYLQVLVGKDKGKKFDLTESRIIISRSVTAFCKKTFNIITVTPESVNNARCIKSNSTSTL